MKEATAQCVQENADIAHVTTSDELRALNEFLSTYPDNDQKFWIGLKMVLFYQYHKSNYRI